MAGPQTGTGTGRAGQVTGMSPDKMIMTGRDMYGYKYVLQGTGDSLMIPF